MVRNCIHPAIMGNTEAKTFPVAMKLNKWMTSVSSEVKQSISDGVHLQGLHLKASKGPHKVIYPCCTTRNLTKNPLGFHQVLRFSFWRTKVLHLNY